MSIAKIELVVLRDATGRYALMQRFLPSDTYVELFAGYDMQSFYIDVMAKLAELNAGGYLFHLDDRVRGRELT